LYRRRWKPEDFITEGLVDLLNRPRLCQTLVIKNFLKVLLQGGVGENAALGRLLEKVGFANHCSWVRSPVLKYRGATKFPDVGLCDGGGPPLVLIEVKIGAGFTQHLLSGSEQEESEDGKERRQLKGQLEVYDEALVKENPDGVCGLILLTHSTDSPTGFLRESGPYKTPCRAVSRWHSVQKWLSKREDEAASLEDNLAKELSAFLEEKGLAQMEEKDIEAGLSFDRQCGRLPLYRQTTTILTATGTSRKIGVFAHPEQLLDKRKPDLSMASLALGKRALVEDVHLISGLLVVAMHCPVTPENTTISFGLQSCILENSPSAALAREPDINASQFDENGPERLCAVYSIQAAGG